MYMKNQEKFWVRTYSQKAEEERMRKSFISDARNEGRTEERYKLISKMASENIPVSMIAKVTNMKVQDVHRVIRS